MYSPLIDGSDTRWFCPHLRTSRVNPSSFALSASNSRFKKFGHRISPHRSLDILRLVLILAATNGTAAQTSMDMPSQGLYVIQPRAITVNERQTDSVMLSVITPRATRSRTKGIQSTEMPNRHSYMYTQQSQILTGNTGTVTMDFVSKVSARAPCLGTVSRAIWLAFTSTLQ